MDIPQIIYDFTSGINVIWWVFLGLIVLFLLGMAKRIPRSTASSLMVSLGIGGTFLGIFLALQPLDFSPEKINDSVTALLDGMKTAFVTSLMGIFFAIGSRFLWSLNLRNLPPDEDKLEAIRKAIAGDGDSSMVNQIRALRDENKQGLDTLDKKMEGLAEAIKGELVKSLEDLIKQIEKVIADQLVKSLEDLIGRIEEALIKQFGKTFVEFNEGVQAIKKWQEEHKEHVERLTNAFRETSKGISGINTSMIQIEEKTQAIPITMETLGNFIRKANEDVQNLEERLAAFANMKKNAEDAFPAIEKRLKEIGDNLSQSVQGLESVKDTIQGVANSSKNMFDDFETEMKQVLENMRTTVHQSVEDSMNTIRGEARDEIEQVAKEWAKNLVAVAEKCAEAINKVEERTNRRN